MILFTTNFEIRNRSACSKRTNKEGGQSLWGFPRLEITWFQLISREATEGKNQTLVGAIPFSGEYPGPRFEDKFRSANQIDGISIADGGKMAES